MASLSGPEQSSSPDPGSVLCDKCKNSVLDPSQNTEYVRHGDRIQQALQDWLLSPNMWPVGYLIRSPYSPFRVEQELPQRDWRNAFEDLLALESGNDIISDESREQEKAVATKLSWERATYCIEKINKSIIRDAPIMNLAQETLRVWKSSERWAPPSAISWVEKKLQESKERMRDRLALAQAFKAVEQEPREWSAGYRKGYGQWIASLITSGALRGWTSLLKDSEDGNLMVLEKEDPEKESNISISERELHEYFLDGRPLHTGIPSAPLYRVSRRPPAMPANNPQILDGDGWPEIPPDEPILWSLVPERPGFWGQHMAAERITLPSGKTATRVVMKKWLTNGDLEEKVMIEEPGKVLQEVEKAQASIQDRRFGFDDPT